MNVTFIDTDDRANILNGTIISDSERLSHILQELRTREPFICELTGENVFMLDVGIGKDGFVQYSRSNGEPPYLVAVSPHADRSDKYTEFFSGGTPTPIPNRNCMPFELVRQIARYFVATGLAHPDSAWEEV